MSRSIFIIAVIIASHLSLKAQEIFQTPLSERITSYNISVSLDTDAKTVSGRVNAVWVNKSPDIVPDVQLHLYLNAFRSNKSTFYVESGGSPGSREIDYGWVDISSIKTAEGTDLSASMKYIQPDDENIEDMTVLRVLLPEPAAPGDTVILDIDFTSKLPSTIRRTGFADDFFFVGQWFPKFGVYEYDGMGGAKINGWNCHQFHSNSEFYSNHSVYNVDITLPAEYVVGSGGRLVSEEMVGDSLKKITYRAEDIVDFAWTAWPGYLVAEDIWEHVSIRFLYPPGREDQVERQMGAIKNALEYLTERVGPFPWPHVTFVDPPAKGAGSGGMEYTTIFTSTSFPGIPDFLNLPEMVTVHEFGHAYFMGILASNEFEEPWMDEGMNSYWETRIMDHYWGPGKGLINHEQFWLSDKDFQRIQYVKSSTRQVTDNTPASWEYPHGTYGMMSYQKAATWLNTLEGIIGTETMDEVFREYYRVWGFRHPTAEDFVNVTNSVVGRMHGNRFGENMNWFFDQTLYGTGICDYKLAGISNMKIRPFKGIMKSDTGMVLSNNETDNDTVYISKVRLERLGEVILPVEIEVIFDDGSRAIENWDGKARYHDIEYKGGLRVTSARIDPGMKIYMDVNLVNNSFTTEPDKVPMRKIARKLATFIFFLNQAMAL